jgi:hypothetical protein
MNLTREPESNNNSDYELAYLLNGWKYKGYRGRYLGN